MSEEPVIETAIMIPESLDDFFLRDISDDFFLWNILFDAVEAS